jgi:hypothetical protein
MNRPFTEWQHGKRNMADGKGTGSRALDLRLPFAVVALLLAVASANDVRAQESQAPGPEPIGPFAADVRVAPPGFPKPSGVAASLGVAAADLPGRGLALVLGAHWYPLRLGAVSFGIGGEMMRSRGQKTQQAGQSAVVQPVTVRTAFASLAPHISLNFGSRQGWSYLSGGLGWGTFTAERIDNPLPDPESRTRAINYGGGARWFVKKHVAFAFDLRFYAINAQIAAAGRPAFPRVRLTVVSAGISLK